MVTQPRFWLVDCLWPGLIKNHENDDLWNWKKKKNQNWCSRLLFSPSTTLPVPLLLLFTINSSSSLSLSLVDYLLVTSFMSSLPLSYGHCFKSRSPSPLVSSSTIVSGINYLKRLDLSWNQLFGEIPVSLKSLLFLSSFIVAHNDLQGPIPSGGQFDTFPPSSFDENSDLCRSAVQCSCHVTSDKLSLSKKCSNDEAPKLEPTKFQKEQNTLSWFDRKIILMGYGSGVAIGLSMGHIVFSTGRPWWFVSMVERKVLKLSERHKRAGRRRRN